MNENLHHETQALIRSWSGYDPAWLQDYLVHGVEDPRRNAQSILSRHFLIDRLFPAKFPALKHEEIRFATVWNWIESVRVRAGGKDDLEDLLPALRRGSDNAEGLEIPAFVSLAFAALPATADGTTVPNYLETIARVGDPATLADTFMDLWRRVFSRSPLPGPLQDLAQAAPRALRVLEPACGSANDYRFIHACGLADHLDFTGVDLCEANVANARTLFPEVRFLVANALALPFPDASFQVSFVHDLLEHLSLEGLEAALDEMARVTQSAMCLGFFRLQEGPEHIVNPVEDYHINALSLPRLRAGLLARGFQTQAIHIATFLREEFRCPIYHNPNAYTLVAERL